MVEAGAFAGKTSLGLIGWIVSWVILGVICRDKEVELRPVLLVTIILAVVGLPADEIS